MNRRKFIADTVMFGGVLIGTNVPCEISIAINQKTYKNVTARIYNDDGSYRIESCENIIYADYFELVSPDGSLVNDNELFLATSNVYRDDNGILNVDVYLG